MEEYMELIRRAYSQADIFLKPQPSMSMSWLSNSKIIQDRPGASDVSFTFSEKKWLHSIQDTSLSFTDIVQSVEVLITKPGYGLFAEAAFGRKPVFYVGRPDWLEEPYLLQWLKDYVNMIEISKNESTVLK